MSLPHNHDLLQEKGAHNAILNVQFQKIREPVLGPQHIPEVECATADIKVLLSCAHDIDSSLVDYVMLTSTLLPLAFMQALRTERIARNTALSQTSIDFKSDGYDAAQTYRSSCFMSRHSDGLVSTDHRTLFHPS